MGFIEGEHVGRIIEGGDEGIIVVLMEGTSEERTVGRNIIGLVDGSKVGGIKGFPEEVRVIEGVDVDTIVTLPEGTSEERKEGRKFMGFREIGEAVVMTDGDIPAE